MNDKIKKWIESNIVGYEITTSCNEKDMVFIPWSQRLKVLKYLRNVNCKFEYSCNSNYEWIEIIFTT